MTWERVRVECRAGFDGGHPPTFVLEAYVLSASEGLTVPPGSLVYNATSNEIPPRFDLAGLIPGTEYQFVLYASNALGTSSKFWLNATTLNVAEKRTAETRSKLEPLSDQVSVLTTIKKGLVVFFIYYLKNDSMYIGM
jgi:hypothetical protein